jgi:hypothetical protein
VKTESIALDYKEIFTISDTKSKMNRKIIFIPLILYFFTDILELYGEGSYLWIKILLFISIIFIGFYLKIFKKKE